MNLPVAKNPPPAQMSSPEDVSSFETSLFSVESKDDIGLSGGSTFKQVKIPGIGSAQFAANFKPTLGVEMVASGASAIVNFDSSSFGSSLGSLGAIVGTVGLAFPPFAAIGAVLGVIGGLFGGSQSGPGEWELAKMDALKNIQESIGKLGEKMDHLFEQLSEQIEGLFELNEHDKEQMRIMSQRARVRLKKQFEEEYKNEVIMESLKGMEERNNFWKEIQEEGRQIINSLIDQFSKRMDQLSGEITAGLDGIMEQINQILPNVTAEDLMGLTLEELLAMGIPWALALQLLGLLESNPKPSGGAIAAAAGAASNFNQAVSEKKDLDISSWQKNCWWILLLISFLLGGGYWGYQKRQA